MERIRTFQRKDQVNKKCADCTELGPTYVCLDYKTFVCQTCSGIHREFGHKIKSISLSEWSVMEVESIETGGNRRAAAKWLDRWTAAAGAEPDSANDEKYKKLENKKKAEEVHKEIRSFIKQKYVDKVWERQGASPRAAPPEPATPTPSTTSGVSDRSSDFGVSADKINLGVSADKITVGPKLQGGMCDLLFDSGEDQRVLATASVIVDCNESMLDLDCSGLDVFKPVLASPPAPTDAVTPNAGKWTADFNPGAIKANDNKCDFGLFDLNFSDAPTATDEANLNSELVGDSIKSPSVAVNTACDAEEPAAEPAVAEPQIILPEDPGAQLRKAVMMGNSADLLRVVGQAAKPAEPAPLIDQSRFAALQGDMFDELVATSSASQSNNVQSSALPPLLSLQDPPAAIPAVAPALSCTSPQTTLPPASEPQMFADLQSALGDMQTPTKEAPVSESSSPTCQYFDIKDEEEPQSALKLAPDATADPFATIASTPASMPAPAPVAPAPAPVAMPQPVSLQQLGSQDLVQMHSMIEQVLHMRAQQAACSNNAAPATHVAGGTSTSAMHDLEKPSPPKQFNDLLAAFHEKNPIAGLKGVHA